MELRLVLRNARMSNESAMEIGEKIHNNLRGNPLYVDSEIVLNITNGVCTLIMNAMAFPDFGQAVFYGKKAIEEFETEMERWQKENEQVPESDQQTQSVDSYGVRSGGVSRNDYFSRRSHPEGSDAD